MRKKMAHVLAILCACAAPLAPAQAPEPPKTAPPGAPKSAKTITLEAGAKMIQRNAPIEGFDIYWSASIR